MTRLTVTLDEETKALLVTLAGGERKVSAFLTRTVRDMESGLLEYVEDKETAAQIQEETRELQERVNETLEKVNAQVRYVDERIEYMNNKLKQAGVKAEDLLRNDKQ